MKKDDTDDRIVSKKRRNDRGLDCMWEMNRGYWYIKLREGRIGDICTKKTKKGDMKRTAELGEL